MHGLDEYDSEARWFYPAIMRTTTIDPLAEKYYSISPYAWCGGNPVSRIDPDGRADFEVNTNNKSIIKNDNTSEDRVFIVNENGDKTLISTFEVGTLKLNEKQVKVDGKIVTISFFEVKGDDNATSLFEAFADPSVTKVEWTHAKVGKENSGRNIVGTNFDEGSTAVGSFLARKGYTLREVIHNHTSGNFNTSPEDKINYITTIRNFKN